MPLPNEPGRIHERLPMFRPSMFFWGLTTDFRSPLIQSKEEIDEASGWCLDDVTGDEYWWSPSTPRATYINWPALSIIFLWRHIFHLYAWISGDWRKGSPSGQPAAVRRKPGGRAVRKGENPRNLPA